MSELQENVDLTFMFKYLKDYNSSDKKAIYVIPEGFVLNVEKIKLYFGEESSMNWNRGASDSFCRYLVLYLKDGINYTLFPDEQELARKEQELFNQFWT